MLPSFWVVSTKRCKDAGSTHSSMLWARLRTQPARRVIAGQKPVDICWRGTRVGSVCPKCAPPAVCVRPPRAGATFPVPYLISFWTSPALLAAGILIEPLMIFALAAVISAQAEAGMYFDFSSEMPPFFRLRS